MCGMSEPTHIRAVADKQPPQRPALTASAWQDILGAAAGASPEVAATTALAYVAHEVGETVRTYIGQKGETDRARITAREQEPAAPQE